MNDIQLRALTYNDLQFTLKWNNQEAIRKNYLGHPFPVNEETERKWYEKVLSSNFPVSVFGIEHAIDKKLIGISVLRDIHMINRVAEFAIYIGEPDYRGKGFSKAATMLTLSFAFHELGLNRVFLKVLEGNTPAIKLYEAVGFEREGILRKSVFKNNTFHNEVIYAIFKDDFNG
jgi:RimJ/RimL family protein N-acetyltransferase